MTTTFSSDKVKPELNQYWYSPRTIWALTEEVALHGTTCAFLSTPSLFFALDDAALAETFVQDEATREEHIKRRRTLREQSRLFEFDRQWSSDAAFTFYDFRYPDQIPVHYMGSFDYVVADPPFITEDVWEQYMRTVKMLLKKDGKVLFTTVLENHTMLEGLWDGPLFIPPFFPLVQHLTYQYVCYTSYPSSSAALQSQNPEVSDVDTQVLAAIRMANDLRESEKAFAAQMETRDRNGEEHLPTAAYDAENTHRQENASHVAPLTAAVAPEDVPIAQMRWSYVPEGLSMYPDGVDPNASATSAATAAACDLAKTSVLYQRVLALRTNVETFKNGIDLLQKTLDRQLRARHQRLKERKSLAALCEEAKDDSAEARKSLESSIDTLSQAVEEAEAERQKQLSELATLVTTIKAEEAALPALVEAEKARLTSTAAAPTAAQDGEVDGVSLELSTPTYVSAMEECLTSYRAVEVKRVPLQELAADATRKFKSPLFNRMKELLQLMKDVRKAVLLSTAE